MSSSCPLSATPVPPPPEAVAAFGSHLDTARRYAAYLTGTGVERGLLGPREGTRIWERHLLNCVAITDLVPVGSYVCDVGSGAGLPGVPLAIARPDLRVTLLDSLLRRVAFLREVVDLLGLADRVRVVRVRAEDHGDRYDVITSRAVAGLQLLAGWCAPLCRSGGLLAAIRGDGAPAELDTARAALLRQGWSDPSVVVCGPGASSPAARAPSAHAVVVRAVRR